MLDLVQSGRLYDDERFSEVPGPLRRLNDIAFSGDGEPTACPIFPQVVHDVAALKHRRELEAVKLVLITNASMLHRPEVQEALAVLDASNGEIWAKLDAGTEAYYRAIDRTRVPFDRILTNIRDAARVRPLVIQSLFMTVDGKGPPQAEVDAYCRRLGEILAAGGRIASVQVYTVARPPAEANVGPLPAAELDRIGLLVASSAESSRGRFSRRSRRLRDALALRRLRPEGYHDLYPGRQIMHGWIYREARRPRMIGATMSAGDYLSLVCKEIQRLEPARSRT